MKKLIDRGSSGPNGWHGITEWMSCPRRAKIAEEEPDVAREEKDYHVRGHILHTALAHLYARTRSGGEDKYLEPHEAIDAYCEAHPSQYNEKWQGRCHDALDQYIAFWGRETHLETIDVERVLRIKVRDGEDWLDYTGRYDWAYSRKKTGKVYLVDHKVTYAILPKVIDSYALGGQMLGLQRLGRAKFGRRYGGIKLNMIRIPTDGKPCEFKRIPLAALPRAARDFPQTIRACHEIRTRYEEETVANTPGSYGEGCYGRFGRCFAWNRCAGKLV